MAFKFDFGSSLSEEFDENMLSNVDTGDVNHVSQEKLHGDIVNTHASEIEFEYLVNHLPPKISYSRLRIPITSYSQPRSVEVYKRDLFDARFQLLSQDSQEAGDGLGEGENQSSQTALQFLEAPSDLVAGVYEGGLKTWECSFDLVDYLHSYLSKQDDDESWIIGKKIIEIGCGTAVPSLYILQRLFSATARRRPASASQDVPETIIQLQDYNQSVLDLVTFPNVLLTWFKSPLSQSHRLLLGDLEHEETEDTGEIEITTDLISAFRNSLTENKIQIQFYCGPWHDLPRVLSSETKSYDMVLTSETIYNISSMPSLIELLRYTVQPGSEDRTSHLSPTSAKVSSRPAICLVAAKVVYFGVGGSSTEFKRAVQDAGAKIETVLEKKTGVGRAVLQVTW